MNTSEIKRVLEAALLCSPAPLSMNEIRRLFDDAFGAEFLRPVLDDLAADWSQRPVQLVSVASGWRFQSRPEYANFLNRLTPEKAPRYSRAVMETLAIVAYRQPVTRGDIEEIRGVSVSSQIIKTLEDRGWIDMIGHKEVPGRPSLFGTTRQFLDDLGLRTLKELPPIEALGEEAALDLQPVQVDSENEDELALRPDAEPAADAGPEPGVTADAELVSGNGSESVPSPDAEVAEAVASVPSAPAGQLPDPEAGDSLDIDELVNLAESLNLVAGGRDSPLPDDAKAENAGTHSEDSTEPQENR